MDSRPKTIICDIDGTLLNHVAPGDLNNHQELLPGVIQKFQEWDIKGYNIILITGRRESAREYTERQLDILGLFYDQLIMGVGGGERVLINDCKPNGTETAKAINLERNKGLDDINL